MGWRRHAILKRMVRQGLPNVTKKAGVWGWACRQPGRKHSSRGSTRQRRSLLRCSRNNRSCGWKIMRKGSTWRGALGTKGA